MQVIVSREEIEQQSLLLNELKRWECLQKISGEYNRGEIVLSIDGNGGKEKVGLSIDRYGLAHHKTKSPIECCHQEIGYQVANAMDELTKQVCEIIRRHMPIPMK